MEEKIAKQPHKVSDEEMVELRLKLREIDENELVKSDGIFVCSDGTLINYHGSTRTIRTQGMHLDAEELTEIINLNEEYRSLISKRTVLRRRIGGEALFTKSHDYTKALERSQELLDLFGKMFSATEVHRIVTTEWKLHKVTYEHVCKFQRDHIEEITKAKEAYQKDTSSLRLVHKRSRLDELTELYQTRKIKYDSTQSQSDYELLLKTLEHVRREVEGQRLTISGQIQVEHEMAVQDHVNTEILKYLNVNDIIIGRLCAKLGVNPKYILYRLHTSYYGKFTGFLPEQMSEENEIHYPSQVVYDFVRIAELNNKLNTEDVDYKEEEPLLDQEKTLSLQELLKKKLEDKQRSINSQKTIILNTDGKPLK